MGNNDASIGLSDWECYHQYRLGFIFCGNTQRKCDPEKHLCGLCFLVCLRFCLPLCLCLVDLFTAVNSEMLCAVLTFSNMSRPVQQEFYPHMEVLNSVCIRWTVPADLVCSACLAVCKVHSHVSNFTWFRYWGLWKQHKTSFHAF